MNHLKQYQLRVSLSEHRGVLLKELERLDELLPTLPYCPCCPGANSICLIDWLRRREATADMESLSQGSGIELDHIKAAVACEYTFTEEEMGRLRDWVTKCNEAFERREPQSLPGR